jgi:AcrR family transcriptional regulator
MKHGARTVSGVVYVLFPAGGPVCHDLIRSEVSMNSRRPTRRIPAQERSRRLVHAVREAGRLILADEGPDALTTTHIAERAGVSVGSIYQYFENREAVLHAIYEDKTDRDVETARKWLVGMGDLSPRERTAQSVRWAFEMHRERLRLDPQYYRNHHGDFRVMLQLPPGESGDSPATELVRSLLRDGAGEMRDIDIDHAAVILGHGVPALLRGILAESSELIEDDAFLESVTDLVCTWLFGAEASATGPGSGITNS